MNRDQTVTSPMSDSDACPPDPVCPVTLPLLGRLPVEPHDGGEVLHRGDDRVARAEVLRARAEEQTLALDAEYRGYMQRVRFRLVPGVF